MNQPKQSQTSRNREREPTNIYGVNAALATIAHRPTAIVEALHSSHCSEELLAALSPLRDEGLPVRFVPDHVLEKQVESKHHEGIVLRVQPTIALGVSALSEMLRRATRATVLALDGVSNPHNVGAIVRSAAFFQADALLLESPTPHRVLMPSAIRIAEGGAETVMIASAPNLADAIGQLKRGSLRDRPLRVFGLESSARTDLRKLARSGPVLWVLGNEREGLSDAVRAQCDQLVSIGGGTGPVDSLNVSVTAGILLAYATSLG